MRLDDFIDVCKLFAVILILSCVALAAIIFVSRILSPTETLECITHL